MAAAVAVTPVDPQMGDKLTIAATGFAPTHAITITIEELGVTLKGTTDGSGNFTSTAVADVVPQNDRPLDIVTNDGTSTVNNHVTVSTE